MNPCLLYVPEAYSTRGPKLMGRNAAGESFLRGFLAHGRATELWVQTGNPADARDFAQRAAAAGRKETVKRVALDAPAPLAQAGLLYVPGPNLGTHARHRSLFGDAAWSLCGITHTTCSAGAMDAIAELLVAPVQSWDAVICTSTAVRDNVKLLLQAEAERLRARLGIGHAPLPALPVIPLGIQTRDFASDAAGRAEARAALGVDEATLVVLFTGRLSFHAKAHPLAMYQALQAASRQTGRKVVLVECGWHANESIAGAYAAAAALGCPDVRVVTLDGRDAGQRRTAWCSADLFCSLADNIQETFGITPIEAMAAGLPVVVSDWDGYRDTVRDGIDGFRIPTLMPRAGLGGDLAQRHALQADNYDMYCGYTSSLVAVDIQATTAAFAKLFESASMRRQMGEAGRVRAREVYDWGAIIPRYEALWAELAERRQATAKGAGATGAAARPTHPWPARMDPFHAFAGYPTRRLDAQTMLRLVDDDAVDALARVRALRPLAMVDFAKMVLPEEAEIRAVLEAAATGARSAGALVAGLPAPRRAFVLRGLAWLVKIGVLAEADARQARDSSN